MAKHEIEHRGRIYKDKIDEIVEIFQEKGKFLGQKKRLSLIWCTAKTNISEVKDEKIDLRLRVTNGKSEVVLKHGKWGSADSRKEFSFDVDNDQFWDYLEFLRILGYKNFLLTPTIKNDYLYDGVEFSLVEVPGWGYYFEAEILTEAENIETANEKVHQTITSLGLSILDEAGYFAILDEINNRKGGRLNLDETNMTELKKSFADYLSN